MKSPLRAAAMAPRCRRLAPCLFLLIAAFPALLPAQESARILGPIPDGTPPPPEAPQPGFTVRSRDIRGVKTLEQGGRRITIREISPIALPQPASAPPLDIGDPAVQEKIAAFRAERPPEMEMLFISATIFRTESGQPRTLVRLWPEGKGAGTAFWSSGDFSLLTGVPAIALADGKIKNLMLAWSFADAGRPRLTAAARLEEYGVAEIPPFPEGPAAFTLLSGQPAAEALAVIRGLHEILNTRHDELAAAFAGRERLRLRQEADLKMHPPKPKDLTLNTWTLRSGDIHTQAKSGDASTPAAADRAGKEGK